MRAIIQSPINLLYSLLMVLYFFGGTYFTDDRSFRWARLYLIVAMLILIISLVKRLDVSKLKILGKDRYLLFMMVIFVWGMISSFLSIQIMLSIKKTISVLLVCIVFYLIPSYFHTNDEKDNFMTYILLPLNVLMTFLSTINFLYFSGIIDLTELFPWWTTRATIYGNPNTFGVKIMLVLMLMNIYIVTNERFKEQVSKNRSIKIYVLFSYLILIINLMLSSARASLLGILIAFIPLAFIFKKEMAVAFIPLAYFLWKKREDLFILKKLSRGTSGRGKIWEYAIKEVIPKHPFLGVGSGAFYDYMGDATTVKHMHNSYLDEIMSNGFVGFSLWIGILIHIFKNIFKLKKNKYIFIFTILGFMAYSFFEIGLFTELGIKMSTFWVFVMVIEDQLSIQNLS